MNSSNQNRINFELADFTAINSLVQESMDVINSDTLKSMNAATIFWQTFKRIATEESISRMANFQSLLLNDGGTDQEIYSISDFIIGLCQMNRPIASQSIIYWLDELQYVKSNISLAYFSIEEAKKQDKLEKQVVKTKQQAIKSEKK